jgi:integrase
VDLAGRTIYVDKQLDRSGARVEPKTDNAKREIPIMDSLVTLLREHKAASPFKQPGDFVFCSGVGTPLHFRNVARRGLEPALAKAGISTDGEGERVRFHDLRHSHAAMLIAQGHDIAYISKRLGHSKISTTLDVYGHVFDQHRHADRVRERMEEQFGGALPGNSRVTNREEKGGNGAVPAAAEVVEISRFRTAGN